MAHSLEIYFQLIGIWCLAPSFECVSNEGGHHDELTDDSVLVSDFDCDRVPVVPRQIDRILFAKHSKKHSRYIDKINFPLIIFDEFGTLSEKQLHFVSHFCGRKESGTVRKYEIIAPKGPETTITVNEFAVNIPKAKYLIKFSIT